MSKHTSMGRRRDESGLTLIELLVVVIVLAVLSAVVVFAVRGSGDKGKQAALDIDERTIRTAQESFCGLQNPPRYGTMQELVDARLLSAASDTNAVYAYRDFGPCNNTRFEVVPKGSQPTVPALPPGTGAPDTWFAGPSANGSASGTGVATTVTNRSVAASNYSATVLLPSGRVLAAKRSSTVTGALSGISNPVTGFQVFDPAGGATGKWSTLAPPDTTAPATPAGMIPNLVTANSNASVRLMLPLKGDSSVCGAHCGKVLVKITAVPADGMWYLYDESAPEPGTTSLGRFTKLTTAPATRSTPGMPGSGGPYRRQFYTNAIQILRSPCGSICGKVLIVGQGNESGFSPPGTPADPELWDPLTDGFRKLGLETGYKEHLQGTDGECNIPGAPGAGACNTIGSDRAPTLTQLDDGRILMISGLTAQLFDPVSQKFTSIAAPPFLHSASQDTTERLSDGSVLATANYNGGVGSSAGPPVGGPTAAAMIYKPGSGGGSWVQVPNCGDGPAPAGMGGTSANPKCHLVATLPNGKVMAKRTAGTGGRASTSQPPLVFDVTKATDPGGPWTTIAIAPVTTSPSTISDWAITLRETRPGGCGNLCGKVLVIGTPVTGGLGAPTAFYSP